ncbi:MAG: ABC-F family ATP-binding cassette domain-containing protein [Tissierellia bacterium]|nr:ABC-F family ATP-binding cassette domain-containing protein [Tissierellia bacterium]
MIFIKNLIKDIGVRRLFTIDELTINPNDKLALIGNNGVGKTSLLKIIAGLDKDYEGSLEVKESISYIGEEDIISSEIYGLAGLKVDEQLSPGEEQRLNLTILLNRKESFLLVDEPTSHLDLDQQEVLAKTLIEREKGYILISHDRNFINQSCDRLVELIDGKLEIYNGNYSFYLEERLRRRKFAQKEYDNYLAEKKHLEGVETYLEGQRARIRTAPKRMGNSEARLHKMGGQGNKRKMDNQIKSVRSRLERLEVKERPKAESEILLLMPEEERIHSKILIRSESLNKSFGNKVLFNKAEFEIKNGSKTALIGPNGSGKTTLLKMIIQGEGIWLHPNLKIGYYSQLEETINTEKSILNNILTSSIYDQTLTRIVLARLAFKEDDVHKKVEVLSDGERAKVKLAKILTSNFNFLIFDEPTNYLDLRAIEALEELLEAYDRSFIFVSHDVNFINKIATNLLIIEDKKLKAFEGNFQEYKNRKNNPIKADEDSYMIDFRLSSINSRLTMDISKEERESLEEEYKELIRLKKK